MKLSDTCWVYDFLLTPGGAERVTIEVARHWPQLDVWVASRNPDLEFDDPRVRALSRRQPSRFALARALETRMLFRRHRAHLDRYRQVVFSGMYAPTAQLVRPAPRAMYYAHTVPLPYAFDWREDYRARLPRPVRPLFDRFATRERALFARAMRAMDRVIANSRFVAERYRHHFGITAEVVYPPVAVGDFHWQPPQDYFVLIASLEPHKRVDLAIRAFRDRPEQLIVVGHGSQRAALEGMAAGHSNLRLVGPRPRHFVVNLLANCRASLCLSRGEAFGMAAIESLAAGKPVIAVAEGAFPELIEPGVTGALIEADIGAIRDALTALTPAAATAMREACRRRAANFQSANFYAAIEQLLVSPPTTTA